MKVFNEGTRLHWYRPEGPSRLLNVLTIVKVPDLVVVTVSDYGSGEVRSTPTVCHRVSDGRNRTLFTFAFTVSDPLI